MSLYVLPDDLPAPVDDGACDHLEGMPVPALTLASSPLRVARVLALTPQPGLELEAGAADGWIFGLAARPKTASQ